jgi:enoyl-CoA hydratase/carnithine racemase
MSPTDQPPLRVDHSAGVLLLTLNRPGARNALSPGLVDVLDAALTTFAADDELSAAVITGSGSVFCGGVDLKVYAAHGADRRAVAALIHRFGDLPKPIIGAINGPAVAGGSCMPTAAAHCPRRSLRNGLRCSGGVRENAAAGRSDTAVEEGRRRESASD